MKVYSLQQYRGGPEEDYVLYADHVAVVCKLRDKLMELAKECEHCDGTGIVTQHNGHTWAGPHDEGTAEDCPACADIRMVLE
jgi:hypothetical protein